MNPIILHSFFASQVILVKHDFDNLSFALIGVLIGELRPIILLLLLTLQLLQVEPRILDRRRAFSRFGKEPASLLLTLIHLLYCFLKLILGCRVRS